MAFLNTFQISVLFVLGPPGIGKTTTAYLVCEVPYHIITRITFLFVFFSSFLVRFPCLVPVRSIVHSPRFESCRVEFSFLLVKLFSVFKNV
jgi:hypothetical protein